MAMHEKQDAQMRLSFQTTMFCFFLKRTNQSTKTNTENQLKMQKQPPTRTHEALFFTQHQKIQAAMDALSTQSVIVTSRTLFQIVPTAS